MTYLHAGDWDIDANGVRGTLHIHEIDELGRISGTAFEQPITGWWGERARRLSFLVDGQGFEGYAWDSRDSGEAPRSYYLAGSLETFGDAGGAKDRQTFGWFATLREPVIGLQALPLVGH